MPPSPTSPVIFPFLILFLLTSSCCCFPHLFGGSILCAQLIPFNLHFASQSSSAGRFLSLFQALVLPSSPWSVPTIPFSTFSPDISRLPFFHSFSLSWSVSFLKYLIYCPSSRAFTVGGRSLRSFFHRLPPSFPEDPTNMSGGVLTLATTSLFFSRRADIQKQSCSSLSPFSVLTETLPFRCPSPFLRRSASFSFGLFYRLESAFRTTLVRCRFSEAGRSYSSVLTPACEPCLDYFPSLKNAFLRVFVPLSSCVTTV